MQPIIIIALIVIVGALAGAGFFMLRKGSGEKRGAHMARALAVRVGVSIALFLFILLSNHLGWIQPSGLTIGH